MIGRVMVSALALMGVAQAQEPTPAPATPASAGPSSDRVVYEAAFFTQFSPQNAADMVAQVPGFSLDGGADRRGFSGAVGNLLIDGERPISKSQSLNGILSRIPASQVVRIEVLRGAAVAGDASGQSTLLNVVRTPTAGSGVWSAGAEHNRDRLAPQGDASWSGRAGRTEYGFGGSYYSQYRSLPGYRNLFDAAGAQTGHVDTPSPRDFREAALNGNYATPILGGRFSATGQLDAWRFHADNGLTFFVPVGTRSEAFQGDFTEHQWSFEVGLNYDRQIAGWDMSLVGLINRRYYENEETDTDVNGVGALNFAINQAQQRDSGETIARVSFARDFTPQHHFEIGIEGAVNTLDAALDFTQDTGAGPVTLAIPNSNVTVEEKRSEAFVHYTWRPNDRWSVESRLARESSTLTFTGDTNQSVELAYLKPSIQVSRNFGEHNQFRVRAFRDVGQLDFGDFVSAASVVDNLINGGNPDLKPQTAYIGELGADLRLPAGIALNITYSHHWISDASDVVQVVLPGANPGDPPIRFDAPGNIGDGEANRLTSRLTLPLGFLLAGGKLTLNSTYAHTEVTDPVTGRLRQASGQSEWGYNGEFRQDLNAHHFAWGFNFEKFTENQVFRFNETDTSEEGPYVDMFAESTAIQGLKLKVVAANILNSPVRRQRLFFAPDRNGPLTRYEERQRQFDHAPWLIFTVSGTF